MKKSLFPLAFVFLVNYVNHLQAQTCNLNVSSLNLIVDQANSVYNNDGSCVLYCDLFFEIQNNGGNKQIYINLWKTADYAAGAGEFSWTSGNDLPNYTNMDGDGTHGPIAIIGIDITQNKFKTSYPAVVPSGVFLQGDSIKHTFSGSLSQYMLYGIRLKLPNCDSISLKGNIVASNSNKGMAVIQCYSDSLNFSYQKITISGNMVCWYASLSLTATQDTKVSYKVYADADSSGTLTPADLLVLSATDSVQLLADKTTNLVTPAFTYNGSDTIYKMYRTHFVEVSYINSFGTTTTVLYKLTNPCPPLPVELQSFTATRSQQQKEQVLLKWETASEQNCKGFYIQKIEGNVWKNVTFIATRAEDGVSNSKLLYVFTDDNPSVNDTRYRIQQVDINGKTSLSEERVVTGSSISRQVIISPNPGVNGRLKLMFTNPNSTKDVIVYDAAGRLVYQFKQIQGNQLQIEKLVSGFYTIKIIDRSTQTTDVLKAIVTN